MSPRLTIATRLLVIALLLFPSLSFACPPGQPVSKVDLIRYEVDAGNVYRHNVTQKERKLVPELSDVVAISQSHINCTFDAKREPKWQTAAEPIFLAILRKDGTVWVRGRIWAYWELVPGVNSISARILDNPPLLFDSPDRFTQIAEAIKTHKQHPGPDTKVSYGPIQSFTNIVRIAAGESFFAAIDRDGRLWQWGWHPSGEKIDRDPYHYGPPTESMLSAKRPHFAVATWRRTTVRDVIVYRYSIYMLATNGIMEFEGALDSVSCRWEERPWTKQELRFKREAVRNPPYRRPYQQADDLTSSYHAQHCGEIGLFGNAENPVIRIWQSPESASECNAEFRTGERWTWPCYDSSHRIIDRPATRRPPAARQE